MENTMKIKTKLAISFCIIIFVPVVLTSIVLVGFNKIQLKAINKTYGMEDAGMLALTDTVQFLNKVTGRTYDELEKTSLIEPSRLLDSDYLTKINKKLEKKYSYLIVKSEGELIFNGGIDKPFAECLHNELSRDIPANVILERNVPSEVL